MDSTFTYCSREPVRGAAGINLPTSVRGLSNIRYNKTWIGWMG